MKNLLRVSAIALLMLSNGVAFAVDNQVRYNDQNSTPLAFFPRTKDLGSSVFLSIVGIANTSGAQIGVSGAPIFSELEGTLPAFAAIPTFKIDQTTPGTTNLVQVGGTLPAFATPPAVAQSGTWNITNVSGTVSLPTGAATSAAQTTGNNSLAAIDAGIPAALGQTTKSASMSVTVASDQGQVQVGAEGIASVVPTVTTTAYAANDVIGGVITLPVFRAAGGSGVLSELSVRFLGASQVPELSVYIFEINPNQAGTTTTDNGAVAFGNLDWTNLVNVYSITPATANGITKSFGSTAMSVPVKNRDGTPTVNLYAVVVTKSAVTLAVGDLVVHARVSQD